MMSKVGRNIDEHDGQPRSAPVDERAAEWNLVRRCREGERAACDEFYRNHRRQVAATLYRVLSDRTDLDDLVQEVFVIAFRGLDRFRGEARISTWLYRICINVALGKIRSRRRKPPPIPMAEPIEERAQDSPETPERTLQRRRDRELVYAALATLPPKKRIVLFLHEIQGLDLKQIAYIVGANPVTVRTRLFYARKEFFALVAGQGGVPRP
jgi:RNA polymerase sigma-70 factor (ECF subfamily)